MTSDGNLGDLSLSVTPSLPIKPDAYDRRAEVDRLLAEDETKLGVVYQLELEGNGPAEIARIQGDATYGYVYSYDRIMTALRSGETPDSPTTATQVLRRVNTWLKNKDLSKPLRSDLEHLVIDLQNKATSLEAQEHENVELARATEQAEEKNTPGVYVYALPHYLRYPVDPDTSRTYLKVGQSTKDAFSRMQAQARITALPEDPVLLRIYPCEDPSGEEAQFHAWLEDASHQRPRQTRAGREWFLTSTRFLDRIANSRNLSIQIINDEVLTE